MIILKFRQDLLHDGFTEEHRLGSDPELVTILIYSSHLTVIQIDNLSMPTYQSSFLLLKILRIYMRMYFFLFGHFLQVSGLDLFFVFSAAKLIIF